MSEAIKRGDIVSVAVGSGFGGKPRPALIVQNDDLATFPNVVVALFSTWEVGDEHTRPTFTPSKENGLREPSLLMTDIVITAPRSKIGHYIGTLSAVDMRRAETALLYTLGFN